MAGDTRGIGMPVPESRAGGVGSNMRHRVVVGGVEAVFCCLSALEPPSRQPITLMMTYRIPDFCED